MSRFLHGFMFGIALSAAGVALFTHFYLRDDDGWELWTAQETDNLKNNITGLLMQNMLLQRILKERGCT